MKILAIDTSTEYLSLAVMDGYKVLARLHRKAAMMHSSLLVPMIAKILKKAKVKPERLDGFAISIGPGSFTGLRIGVVTVKGLSYALKKPVAAVPTLDVIAGNARNFKGIVCPVLDARKNKVYACFYKSDGVTIKKISKYLLMPINDFKKRVEAVKSDIIFLGDGVDKITPEAKGPFITDWHPKAEIVGQIGFDYLKKKKIVSPESLEPLYLYSRECDITGI